MQNWAKDVKVGDYIKVVSNTNAADESVEKVTRVTTRTVFADKRQFSKTTCVQLNNKRRMEPFLARHIKKAETATKEVVKKELEEKS